VLAGKPPERLIEEVLDERLRQLGAVRKDPRRIEVESPLRYVELLLNPWHVMRLPDMSEGLHLVPGLPDTGGIDTVRLEPGFVKFFGRLRASAHGGPLDLQWWVTNWKATVVFPPAPEKGMISYRLVVENVSSVYNASALEGLLLGTVTLGTTSDVAKAIDNWDSVGWPTNVDLKTLKGLPRIISGGVPVSGTIEVAQGARAALGLIFVELVGMVSGYVEFSPDAAFLVRQETGFASYEVDQIGNLEYRFDPQWWTKAVEDRVAFQRRHLP
jgi:hypothetical protein